MDEFWTWRQTKNMNEQMDLTIENTLRFLQVFGTEKNITISVKQTDLHQLDQFFTNWQMCKKQQ